MWMVLGKYSDIVSNEDDEELEWEYENNKPVLHVLLVRQT